MDRGPSFWIWTASLIHLVDRSDSLSITDAADQLITWFSWTVWSVSADLLDSADELERWLLVKARFVFDSTSDLCSCNNWLTRYGFLLVFYSESKSRWNCCQVISRQSQQNKKNDSNAINYSMNHLHSATWLEMSSFHGNLIQITSCTNLEFEFQFSPVSSFLTLDSYYTTQFHRQCADQNAYNKQ